MVRVPVAEFITSQHFAHELRSLSKAGGVALAWLGYVRSTAAGFMLCCRRSHEPWRLLPVEPFAAASVCARQRGPRRVLTAGLGQNPLKSLQ
jgi:hypothetical protein